jgi:hypothetical protein
LPAVTGQTRPGEQNNRRFIFARYTRNNWICYEFVDRRVTITHYTIRTDCEANAGVSMSNSKSWIVEVSADGEGWTEVDHRENTSELNNRDVTELFQVAKSAEGRFMRPVNVGKNHKGTDSLCLSSFEIFGTLIE